ncbi:hypothetical protein BC826DRAFT_1048982 [Russula brevipes]|nr:hypothetical protein BC826DRAFT_1048982 [Russula brevipes]
MEGVPCVADLRRKYKDILAKVKEWANFNHSNISRNDIHDAGMMDLPTFVEDFERMLDRKPILDPMHAALYTALQELGISGSYFEPLDEPTEGESPEMTRYAGLSEVLHTVHHVAYYRWETVWDAKGSTRNPLKEQAANSIFFAPLVCTPRSSTVDTLRLACLRSLGMRC